MKYEWKQNAWVSESYANVSKNKRLVRMGTPGRYLYKAENWGDYSLAFPVHSGWHATPAQALAAL